MEKKNNEGKEDWLEFYKLTILPLVMWKTHVFLYKKKITSFLKKCTLHTIINYGGYIARFWNSKGQCAKHIICWEVKWNKPKKFTILPSIMWIAHTFILKKINVVSQKMHIACNYKGWEVHCSILNSMGQCARHAIGWGVKSIKPLINILSVTTCTQQYRYCPCWTQRGSHDFKTCLQG